MSELKNRLIAIGEKIKCKGWKSVQISINISYLAMFDQKPGPLDPMIFFRPSIRATVHHSDRNGDWSDGQQGYNAGASWGIKTFDDAVAQLEELAEKMPRMADESARIKAAKAKLSEEERRLLGVR
jgi:hypothetical protein